MVCGIPILLLAVPVGFLLAWLGWDELIVGRKYFKILIVLGIVLGIGGWLFGFSAVGWSGGFIAIVSFISYLKSFDKKWTKRKH